ncbi:unnamed protein product [Discosporangium mesarthrocarpum]
MRIGELPRLLKVVAFFLVVFLVREGNCGQRGDSAAEDYYKVLGISKDATDKDITRAYRKQALKWHPDKNRDDPKKAEERFKSVSEAYEVLSDQNKRQMYDMYGKEGLFAGAAGGSGVGNPEQAWGQGRGAAGSFPPGFGGQGNGAHFFNFQRGSGSGGGKGDFDSFTDPMHLFESIFGGGGGGVEGFAGGNISDLLGGFFGSSTFDDLPSMRGNGLDGMEGRGRGRRRSGAGAATGLGGGRGGAPVEKVFSCTLRELSKGCEKKLRATDTVVDPVTGQTRAVSHVYHIAVKPGWKEGTKVTFPPTADGLPSMRFVLREKPHKYLRREGDSLVYVCRVTEQQAQRGVRVRVPLLGKGDPPVEVNTKGQEVHDGLEMVLPELGMPVKGGPRRGPFKIRFEMRPSKAFAA